MQIFTTAHHLSVKVGPGELVSRLLKPPGALSSTSAKNPLAIKASGKIMMSMAIVGRFSRYAAKESDAASAARPMYQAVIFVLSVIFAVPHIGQVFLWQ